MLLPENIALVEDDADYRAFLAEHLRRQGAEVHEFDDCSRLLTRHDAFDFRFYLVDLLLPDVDGTSLVRILRKRTSAGVVVLSGAAHAEAFGQAVEAGADMFLMKPATFDQVTATVQAVHRRASAVGERLPWRLDRRESQLIAPDSVRIDLSRVEFAIFEALAAASGKPVAREALLRALAQAGDERATAEAITALIFRLRRRIERETPAFLPLQSKSKVGYEFRAPLQVF